MPSNSSLPSSRLYPFWALVALLSILCIGLAFLQNHWIDEISIAERTRLQSALQADLSRVSQDFDERLGQAYALLVPSFESVTEFGSTTAFAQRYNHWRNTAEPTFRQVGLVVFEGDHLTFSLFDSNSEKFVPADWPKNWNRMRGRLEARLNNSALPTLPRKEQALLDLPIFGSMHRSDEAMGSREDAAPPLEDWLVLELNLDYLRDNLIPDLFTKDLQTGGATTYDFALGPAESAEPVLSGGDRFQRADASVGVLNLSHFRSTRAPSFPAGHTPRQIPVSGIAQPRWQLSVRRHGGSLDDLVSGAKWKNIGLSASLLLLIITSVLVLVRLTRQSQQLVQLQVNFVASVSHELRTPLTVIRTLAFNLRGGVSQRPEQVERYGKLIEAESEKLSTLVDQVLRYGSLTGGKIIGERNPVSSLKLIEVTVQSSSVRRSSTDLVFETEIPDALPMVVADELAMRHVLHNLLENAVKYGMEGSNWVKLAAAERNGFLEIRVCDRGLGIPRAEQARIFDAFFRGSSAVHDQVHGTGLGLNLAKRIVEAHGGTIGVESEPGNTTFLVKIPVAPEEMVDAFSHTSG